MSNGILWAFGDSFTAGNAKDISRGTVFPMGNAIGKPRAYPELIARRLRLRCVNLAEGGRGNNEIVSTLIKATPNFDPHRDFIIVGLTTPFRNRIESTPMQALKYLIEELSMIEKVLNGYKYIITSAFCPLVPYYFSTEDLDFNVPNYVEWGKPNNTLIDICGGTWLDSDKDNPVVVRGEKFLRANNAVKDSYDNPYFESCGHPSSAGHKLIAETLAPYVAKVAKPKSNSYI